MNPYKLSAYVSAMPCVPFRRPSVFPGTERNGTERSGPETPPYYTERTRGQSTARTTASLSILSSGRQTETVNVDVD